MIRTQRNAGRTEQDGSRARSADRTRRSGIGRGSALIVGGLALTAVAGVAAVGIGAAMARRVVRPETRPDARVLVHAVEQRGEETFAWLSGPGSDLPGRYSLLFAGGAGHARLGPVRQRRGPVVSRPVVAVDHGRLESGETGRITGWWHTDPAELGARVERIAFPGETGELWAWLVRPKRPRKGRWAVHVHGRGAPPEEALRGVAPLARAGITSLVIAYRNDPGAPAGTSGRYGLGLAEQADVDSAIAEARSRGARRVTLFGWSMGATACLLAATSGPHAHAIDGIVLDSPAIDWSALLRHQARQHGLPAPVISISLGMLRRGIVRGGTAAGIDFDSLSPESFAEAVQVPVLIHASLGDTFVPPDGALRLAQLRPELVQLRLQRLGEHVRLWNVDPEPWERTTYEFVRHLPRPAWRGSE